jgi:hypothetical protein
VILQRSDEKYRELLHFAKSRGVGSIQCITHTRECPGLAHARVAAESDSESDENPQLRDDDVSTTTNDALLDVSFIDTAIPAFSWSWLDALDMSSLPQTRTIDKLPAWVMSATSQIVNQIITDRLITNPNDERGTKLLNIYPHLVLNLNNTRAGSHNQLLRNLKSRVYKFARGQWQLLSMQVMCKRAKRAPVPPSEASMAQRAVRYVQFGDLRKARQALTPAPSAPASDATALTLSQLHPHASAQCPDDVLSFVPSTSFTLDRGVFDDVIESLPRGRAAGRSGWRYEDAQYLCVRGSASADAMYRYMSDVAAGLVTQDEAGRFWGTATLIALSKPNNGVRPIAMGEVFRKIVSRIMLKQLGSTPATSVGVHQFGVSRPGGLEAVVLALRILLEDDDHNVILSIDVSNAYNTFDRNLALRIMMDIPELAQCVPFLRTLYGNPAMMLYDKDDDDIHVIKSERGTQQGDPWSSLLFSLVHTHAMDRVRARHPNITALSYQDDTNIVTDVHTAAAVLATVEEEFARVDLTVNKSKCILYSRTPVTPSVEHMFAGVNISHEGVIVLGSPVGSNSFMRVQAQKKLQSFMEGASLLPKMADPQAAFKLLRDSYNARASYLARTIPPGVCESEFVAWDLFVWDCAYSIFGFDKLGLAVGDPKLETARLQAFMPVRLAGLGLRSLHRISPCAFLGGLMDAAGLLSGDSRVQAFFASVQSVVSPLRTAMIDARDELPASAQYVCPNFADFTSSGTRRTQANLTKAMEKDVFRAFVNKHARKDRARLLSAAGPGAGAWLLATPRTPDLTLTSDLMITSVCRLLHLPQPALVKSLSDVASNSPNVDTLTCNLGSHCGADVDLEGVHVMHCRNYNARNVRHDVIKDLMADYIKKAGYLVTVEDRLLYRVSENDSAPMRPDIRGEDITHGLQTLSVDVSVVDATCNEYVNRREGGSSVCPRYAAGVRAREKVAHYAGVHRAQPNIQFVPFIIESHGAIGVEAVLCINNLSKRIVERRAFSGINRLRPPQVLEALVKNELKQKLSIALQRVQASSLNKGALYMSGRAAASHPARAAPVGTIGEE